MVLKKVGIAAAVALAGIQVAHANDLNINGFMTVGVGTSDSKVSVDGMDNNANYTNDAILGLQISKQLNDTTSATGQLVSRGTDNFSTEAAWAYVTYAVDDTTDLRIGRLRTPFFYYSDFLEVGYAYNWTRPPAEVYRLLSPFSSVNGVDLTHHFSMGGTDASIQLYHGNYDGDFDLPTTTGATIATDISLKDLTGAVFSATHGNFGARLSYHQAIVTANGTISQSVAMGPGTANVNFDAFSINEKKSRFYEAALTYDNGDISFITEWTQLKHENPIFTDNSSYLISVGKRISDTTLYVMYSATADDASTKYGQSEDQSTSSVVLGTRYDYDSSTAIKLEAQHTTDNPDTLTVDNKEVSGMAYTVSLNVVF